MCKSTLASILLLIVGGLLAGCSDDRKPVDPQNQPPRILSVTAEPDSVWPDGTSSLGGAAEDPDGDPLLYEWSAQAGALQPQGAAAVWTAPDSPGVFTIRLDVRDGNGGADRDSVRLTVRSRPNQEPVIVRLTANPEVPAPGDTVQLGCVARDDDGDALEYGWSSDQGTFLGEGAAVSWIAPATPGSCEIRALVTDDFGGEARDTLVVEVFGTLLLQTRDGLMAARPDGSHWLLAPGETGAVEVLDSRIFLKADRGYVELDHQGTVIGGLQASDLAVGGRDYVMLPDAGFAILDNDADVMHICGPDGTLRRTVAMPNGDAAGLQNTTGIVIGDRLVVSENGNYGLIEVDLTTLEASIFRTIPNDHGWLGAIDYLPGEDRFYLCRLRWLQEFVGAGEVHDLASFTRGSLTGVVAIGDHVYVCVNAEGTLYRVNRATGQVELLADEINYPEDLEYLPVRLSP